MASLFGPLSMDPWGPNSPTLLLFSRLLYSSPSLGPVLTPQDRGFPFTKSLLCRRDDPGTVRLEVRSDSYHYIISGSQSVFPGVHVCRG